MAVDYNIHLSIFLTRVILTQKNMFLTMQSFPLSFNHAASVEKLNNWPKCFIFTRTNRAKFLCKDIIKLSG